MAVPTVVTEERVSKPNASKPLTRSAAAPNFIIKVPTYPFPPPEAPLALPLAAVRTPRKRILKRWRAAVADEPHQQLLKRLKFLEERLESVVERRTPADKRTELPQQQPPPQLPPPPKCETAPIEVLPELALNVAKPTPILRSLPFDVAHEETSVAQVDEPKPNVISILPNDGLRDANIQRLLDVRARLHKLREYAVKPAP